MKNWGSKVRYWISSVFKVKLNFKVKVLCWTFYATENMFGDSWTKLDCCSVNSSFYDHIYRSAVKLAADVFFNRFVTKAPSNATWGVGGGGGFMFVCVHASDPQLLKANADCGVNVWTVVFFAQACITLCWRMSGFQPPYHHTHTHSDALTFSRSQLSHDKGV